MTSMNILVVEEDKLLGENIRAELALWGETLGVEPKFLTDVTSDEQVDLIVIDSQFCYIGMNSFVNKGWGECFMRNVVLHTGMRDYMFVCLYRAKEIGDMVNVANMPLSNGMHLRLLSIDTPFDATDMHVSIHNELYQLLLNLGIPSNVLGFKYLMNAIINAMEDSTCINHLTTKLYPNVAKRFGTTPEKVERAIRHAIDVACNTGKIVNINQFWNADICTKYDHPTSGELIALIAEKMLLNLRTAHFKPTKTENYEKVLKSRENYAG